MQRIPGQARREKPLTAQRLQLHYESDYNNHRRAHQPDNEAAEARAIVELQPETNPEHARLLLAHLHDPIYSLWIPLLRTHPWEYGAQREVQSWFQAIALENPARKADDMREVSG